VVGHAAADADEHRDHRVDALVQETHRRGAVGELGLVFGSFLIRFFVGGLVGWFFFLWFVLV